MVLLTEVPCLDLTVLTKGLVIQGLDSLQAP